MIEFQHVTKLYPHSIQKVLDDVSFSSQPGEITAIVGPVGSGKTTLLKVLVGLETPTFGQINVGAQSMTHLSSAQRKKLRQKMGISLAGYAVLPDKTVWDNLAWPLRLRDVSELNLRQTVAHMLRTFELETKQQRLGSVLSVGEQQVVCVGRALVAEPQILILDEPFLHLANNAASTVSSLLLDFQRSGKSIIITARDESNLSSLSTKKLFLKGA